jgi:hypothetical protein
LLLSKALKLQQDDEDRKNRFVISGLEKKIEDLENSLKEKDVLLSSTEGSLPEARLQNEKQGILISSQDVRIEKLSKELKETKTILEENTSRFSHESKTLNMKIKAKAEKSFKLSETLSAFGCNDRTGWDGTIPQIRLFGSGSRVGTLLSSVAPCCPSKLEGRERTSRDDPVLAVPQPNTP